MLTGLMANGFLGPGEDFFRKFLPTTFMSVLRIMPYAPAHARPRAGTGRNAGHIEDLNEGTFIARGGGSCDGGGGERGVILGEADNGARSPDPPSYGSAGSAPSRAILKLHPPPVVRKNDGCT